MVDHGDPVGEAVGLVEVLGGEQHGRAGRDAVLDRRPQGQPAARVEAGGRLVEEQHRRLRHQRGGEVEPAAHAAGVGAHDARAGLDQVEALEQLVGARARARPAQVVEAAHHLEVLLAGEVLVDRGVLAGQPDVRAQLRGVAHDVEARPPARCRRRACSSVVRMRTAVVLPAPFGPSRPSTRAGRRAQVDAVERDHVAVGLAQAVGLDRTGARTRSKR